MFKFIAFLLVIAAIMFSTIYALKSFTNKSGGKNPVSTIESSKKIACDSNIRALNQFIKQYKILHNNETVTLENLKKAGLILPKCEAGGNYTLKGKHFLCTLHFKK